MAMVGLLKLWGVAASVALLVSGCGAPKPVVQMADPAAVAQLPSGGERRMEQDPRNVEVVLVGKIILVHPEHQFALIDAARGMNPPKGSPLIARTVGGVESARMVAGEERERSFLAADITLGNPAEEDLVFWVK